MEKKRALEHAAQGGIERERLEELVAAGMTIAEIASEVARSSGTVRLWLRRHGLRTLAAQRIDVARDARDDGLPVISSTCRYHGTADFVLEGRGYYRCKRCRQERVARRRRDLKAILVAEAGGECSICGYRRYFGALQFHHVDPSQKRLDISRNGVTLAVATLRAEARKCVLLCSNCHAEIEGGVADLPGKVPQDHGPPAGVGPVTSNTP